MGVWVGEGAREGAFECGQEVGRVTFCGGRILWGRMRGEPKIASAGIDWSSLVERSGRKAGTSRGGRTIQRCCSRCKEWP